MLITLDCYFSKKLWQYLGRIPYMADLTGSNSFQNISQTPLYSLTEQAKDYILRYYPQAQIIEEKNKTKFILQALAYTDTIIFIYCSCNTLKTLQKRINADIAKLNKIKYPSTQLYYFVDSTQNILRDQNLSLSRQYSSNGYNVVLLDEKTIIEHLISSKNTIKHLDNNSLRSFYEYQSKTSTFQHNILEELISVAYVEVLDQSIITPLDKKLFHLKPKIKENFVNLNAKSVFETYNALWIEKEAVEHFIRNNFHRYERQLKAILDKIRNTFKNLKHNHKSSVEFPVNDPYVFEQLADLFIPSDKKSDPRYFSTAKALILYFFEYCDFGKKYKDDPPSLFSNTIGSNDSTNQI